MLDAQPEQVWQQPVASFVTALENIFVEVRGRGVCWSADDRERAVRWQQVGVSLPRVVRVVESRAKAWRYVHGDLSSLPISLRYYEKAVLAARPDAAMTASEPARACVTTPPQARQLSTQWDANSEEILSDRLYELLDRVPDLIAATDDPAIAQAYKKAGLALGRSLQGKTVDCEAGIDEAGFTGAIGRALRAVRKTVLDGVGPTARDALLAPIDAKILQEGLTRRAAKRRREKLIDRALRSELGVLLPTADGWQGRTDR